MTLEKISADERALLFAYRRVKISGHGRIAIEIRDGKPQMMEETTKTRLN